MGRIKEKLKERSVVQKAVKVREKIFCQMALFCNWKWTELFIFITDECRHVYLIVIFVKNIWRYKKKVLVRNYVKY